MTATNPFFEISLLPYQAPHFDQINDSHYRPAFDEALRQKRRVHYPTTVDRLPERYEEPTSDEMERLPYDDLKRLIAELPDGYRTVFNLYCIEELSHREIAERLGISEKTSSSQLFRAKALLARRIKEYVKDK